MNEEISFSDALIALKKREAKVARSGWNGKGMWIELNKTISPDDAEYKMVDFIVMKTVDDKLVPWLASQTDILADDWTIL